MNRQNAKYVLLALGVVAIFAILAMNAQRIDQNLHNQYRGDLRQLEGLHALLNENVLRAKLGLLTYYDPLNETLSAIDQVRVRLDQPPSFISQQSQRDIKRSLAAYDRLLTQQRDLVERFKAQNAVVINSLSYFTIVVSDLTSGTSAAALDPTIKSAMNGLLQDILLFNTTGGKALIPRIQAEVDLLQQNRAKLTAASSSIQVDLDALINHTNIVVQRKPILDSLIDEMSRLSIPKQLSELSDLYDAGYEGARQSAAFYQAALYIFSLVVVGYIAASIIARLRKSATVIRNAKDELQITYTNLEKRSGELQSANTELQKATQQAHEASRLKSEFLSTMSHELRTPLNAIIGYTGILLMGMDGEIDANAQEMIERVDANSKRLLKLINDILDISKIEAGRMELVETPVMLRQLVGQWTKQIGVLVERKGLAFDCEVDSELPETLYLDRERVTQIAVNLLSNAVKFTESGRVRLSLKRQETSLILQVVDSGVGIPPHALDYIFDEFRQVDGTSRRAYGGTGLGLAIVRNLCRIMNGTVVVESTLGQGSTFTVTLPLKPVAEPETADMSAVA